MVRIGIDYTPAYEQGGGIGRLVRDLVAALAQIDSTTQYRLFVAGSAKHSLPPTPGENFSWKPTRITPRWLARLWHRLYMPLPVEVFTGPVDLYHATDFVLPPHRAHTRTIVTVHDLSFVRVPDAASPRLKAYLDVVVPRSVKHAHHVIADSQATKDDLIDLYDLPSGKISVLLSGIDARFKRDVTRNHELRQKYGIGSRPYIFSVGTVQPRKNYARLAQALAQLHAKGFQVDLVIAGGQGWLQAPIHAAIQAAGVSDHVHFIGFVDDEDLPGLYSNALCVAFPSLYEGFGFPVLEGMACGTPVLTSNVSSLPEVAGDAALLVDPHSVDAIADALQRLFEDEDLRSGLIVAGYQQAKRFTWERSARRLREIYDALL